MYINLDFKLIFLKIFNLKSYIIWLLLKLYFSKLL